MRDLLFFFAIGASTELSIFMAGWSSRNKYSLLGAMRAVAQMISYEVALLLSERGRGHDDRVAFDGEDRRGAGRIQRCFFPHWYVFTPWGFAGFALVYGGRAGRDQPVSF